MVVVRLGRVETQQTAKFFRREDCVDAVVVFIPKHGLECFDVALMDFLVEPSPQNILEHECLQIPEFAFRKGIFCSRADSITFPPSHVFVRWLAEIRIYLQVALDARRTRFCWFDMNKKSGTTLLLLFRGDSCCAGVGVGFEWLLGTYLVVRDFIFIFIAKVCRSLCIRHRHAPWRETPTSQTGREINHQKKCQSSHEKKVRHSSGGRHVWTSVFPSSWCDRGTGSDSVCNSGASRILKGL